MFSFAGFGILACVVLPTPDGAIDSVAEYQQCIGLYALGVESAPAPTPTTTTVTVTTDDHSWFAFAPALMPVSAKAPVSGQWRTVLPAARITWTLEREAERVLPPPPPATVYSIPLAPSVPVIEVVPETQYGVWRSTLPAIRWELSGSVGDPDEDLLIMVLAAGLDRAPTLQRTYLVDRRVVEEEWRRAFLAALQRPFT